MTAPIGLPGSTRWLKARPATSRASKLLRLAEEFVAQAVQQALARGLALPEEILAAGHTRRVRTMLQRALHRAEAR